MLVLLSRAETARPPSPTGLVEGGPAAPEYLRLRHHRNPHVGSRAHLDAEKRGRSYSDYPERIAIDADRLAQDGWIEGESPAPINESWARPADGLLARIVSIGEGAAQGRA